MNAAKCTEPPAAPGADIPPLSKRRRRWGALVIRAARLALAQRQRTADLVTQSYNRIADGYDSAWTEHMRDLSLAMLRRLVREEGDWLRSASSSVPDERAAAAQVPVPFFPDSSPDRHCADAASATTEKGDWHLRAVENSIDQAGGSAPEPVPFLLPGARCIDLACGTGFVTSRLAGITGSRAIGVDASAGMLAAARANYGEQCEFVQADALEFLQSRAAGSADVITCAWALGYGRPLATVRQAARVLRPGGRLGIIDNTLFSLAGVLRAALATFAESPEALVHAMRARFLPHSAVLAAMMRSAGLGTRYCADGSRTYFCPDGAAAVARLRATGAAAGFEFAAAPECEQAVFARFAEIIEDLYATDQGVPITHRYLVCIGGKPS